MVLVWFGMVLLWCCMDWLQFLYDVGTVLVWCWYGLGMVVLLWLWNSLGIVWVWPRCSFGIVLVWCWYGFDTDSVCFWNSVGKALV